MQVYKGFDIGSAKATAADREKVPHHLLDVVNCCEDYDAARYAIEGRAAIHEVAGRNRLPIVVGGSGLYLRALMSTDWHDDVPKDPELRRKLDQFSTPQLAEKLAAVQASVGETWPL